MVRKFFYFALSCFLFFLLNYNNLDGCSWCLENETKVNPSTSTVSARQEALKIHSASSPVVESSLLCPVAEEYFFRQLAKSDSETDTLSFDFEQTADYGIKDFIQKNYGSVFYRKPENVRVDFYSSGKSVGVSKPSRTIVIYNKKFYDYNSATNQCVIADWDKIKSGVAGQNENDLFMSFRADNIKKLKERYNVKLIELSSSSVRVSILMSGVKSTHHAHPDDVGVIMNMDFDLLSDDDVVPLKTDFISGAVRFTTEIKNFKKNPPLDKDVFKRYAPPRGAEIIK